MSEVLVAFALSIGLTPLMRLLALRTNFVDRPNHRKIHHVAMPLLGGVAIYLGSMAGLASGPVECLLSDGVALLGSGFLLMLVGTMDDRGLIHSQFKLVVAIPLAAAILVACDFRTSVFSELLSGPTGLLMDTVFTILWIVMVTSAVSILDHMDGLCAGIAAISFFFFLLIGAFAGDSGVVTMAASLLGGSVGFLCWNANPARIFMGDGGAMFLGLALAALALRIKPYSGSAPVDWCISLLILGVPIFDITLVTFSRLRRGLIPSVWPGRDHTAHRLVSLGRTQRQAVSRIYACALLLGSMACGAILAGPGAAIVLCIVAMTAGLRAIRCLEQTPYERQENSVSAFNAGKDRAPKSVPAQNLT